MKNINVRFLAISAVVCAMYVVFTVGISPLSYGMVQFRFSELLVLLAFIDPAYIPSLILGCLISNFFSPFGMVDVVFGTLHTIAFLSMIALTVKTIKKETLHLFISSLWPAIFSFIIAFEMTFIIGTAGQIEVIGQSGTFLMWALWVALGEFVVVTVIGVPLFKYLLMRKDIVKLLRYKE